MDLYFTDRKFNLLGIASTDGGAPVQFDADTDELSIEAASRTLTLTMHFNDDTDDLVSTMGASGNFILYRDLLGRFVFMEIMELTHDPLAGTHVIIAQDAGVDLLDETVGSYKADKAYPIADYIKRFTADSGWLIGDNQISKLTRTLSWDSDDETALARIISVATQFDGAELAFSFEFDAATQTIKKYINVYKRRGADKPATLYIDHELNNLKTSESIYDLCTSIKGTGGTPEGKNKPINLVGYKWTDPDGRYEIGVDGAIRDTVAVKSWSRILSNSNTSPTGHHLQRVKTYEAVTQATLLQSVLADLKKYNHPTRSYEADIAYLPDNVDVGDTIHLANESEDQYLSTRILTISQCYSLDSATAELGEFKEEESQLSPELQQLADTLRQQAATKQYYPWTRYADDDQGTGMSALASGKKYMAIVWSTNATPSDNPADYAGHWVELGKDGADGQPGAKGDDGKTSYFHTAWADDVDGKTGFTTAGGDGKSYIGTYSDFTEADSDDQTKYKWALFKGDKGADGLDGPKGADGVSSYTHIAYSDSATGTTGFSQTPGSHTYIGFYVDSSPTNSLLASKYKWSLIKGAAGEDGTPGPAGADGKTPYFHQAWANSSDGNLNFSTTDSTDKKYWGTYTDFTQTDSTTPSAYKWVETAGAAEANAKTYTDTQVKPVADKVAAMIPSPTSASAFPASPVKGQECWLINGSAKTKALYEYDGSNWQPMILDKKMITAEIFTGLTFNGVHFIGSDFTVNTTIYGEDGNTKVGTATATLTGGGYMTVYHNTADKTVTVSNLGMTGAFSVVTYDEAGYTDDSTGVPLSTISLDGSGLTILNGSPHSNTAGGVITPEYLTMLQMSGQVLWSGGMYLTQGQIVTPSRPLSKCLNGWLLVWSRYASGVQDAQFEVTAVPKSFAQLYENNSINQTLSTFSTNKTVTKVIYVTDTQFHGNDVNSTAPQNEFALRAVVAN